jgi:hypothetical protein
LGFYPDSFRHLKGENMMIDALTQALADRISGLRVALWYCSMCVTAA